MKWYCPNQHDIEQGVVCGGSDPYYLHGMVDEDEYGSMGNIYFYIDLDTEELTTDVYTPVGFILTDEDWEIMHDHALGGCIIEPCCPECGALLLEAGKYETITEHNEIINTTIMQAFMRMKDNNIAVPDSLDTQEEKEIFFDAHFSYLKKPEEVAIIYSLFVLEGLFEQIGIAFRDTVIAQWHKHKNTYLRKIARFT